MTEQQRPFRVKPKSVLLVSAWDALDAGRELTENQKRALDDWQFTCSMNGTSEAEQEMDRKVLRVSVGLALNEKNKPA